MAKKPDAREQTTLVVNHLRLPDLASALYYSSNR